MKVSRDWWCRWCVNNISHCRYRDAQLTAWTSWLQSETACWVLTERFVRCRHLLIWRWWCLFKRKRWLENLSSDEPLQHQNHAHISHSATPCKCALHFYKIKLLKIPTIADYKNKTQSQTADFAPGTAIWRTERKMRVVFDYDPLAPLSENKTSPETRVSAAADRPAWRSGSAHVKYAVSHQ